MSTATFRRIRADEVMPGMRVARARSHGFALVTATEELPDARWRIIFDGGRTMRSPRDAPMWVREPTQWVYYSVEAGAWNSRGPWGPLEAGSRDAAEKMARARLKYAGLTLARVVSDEDKPSVREDGEQE